MNQSPRTSVDEGGWKIGLSGKGTISREGRTAKSVIMLLGYFRGEGESRKFVLA